MCLDLLSFFSPKEEEEKPRAPVNDGSRTRDENGGIRR